MKSCKHVFFFVKQDKFIKLNLSFSKQLSCSYTSKTGVYIFENSGGWGGDEKFDHLNFFSSFLPQKFVMFLKNHSFFLIQRIKPNK